jgi:hypothetical protein
MDQDCSLAASSTSQQQQRPLGSHNSLLLHLIQARIALPDHGTAGLYKSLLVTF